jgi:hypothetical protein
MRSTSYGATRKILFVFSVLSAISVLSSCHKIRALMGDPSAQESTAPARISGYTDGEQVNIQPGPPPSSSGSGSRGWHVQPFKCGADDKLLGMCGDSPGASSHSSTYVPSYATPQVGPFHQHYGKYGRTR